MNISQRMRVSLLLSALATVLLLLNACSSVTVENYAQNRPLFKPEVFFSGQLTAHGVVKNRSGKVIRYFNADLNGEWQDGIGTLQEQFQFNDGETQQRVWTLTPNADGKFTGTAGDVVGPAQIATAGNAMMLNYTLRLPYKGDTIDVHVDDRMYLVSDTVLINESTLTKFGFRVGEILLTIQKLEP